MLKLLKFVGVIVALAPVLLLAQCMYIETSQRNNLSSLCEKSDEGKKLSNIINEAKQAKFEVRSEILFSEKERDWFNREYDRILKQIKKDNSKSAAHTVVFAKPGIGYYACIIEHENGLIKKSQYEDRSS